VGLRNGHTFSNVLYIVASHEKYTRTLTFENVPKKNGTTGYLTLDRYKFSKVLQKKILYILKKK
jgi:hypothetical protein